MCCKYGSQAKWPCLKGTLVKQRFLAMRKARVVEDFLKKLFHCLWTAPCMYVCSLFYDDSTGFNQLWESVKVRSTWSQARVTAWGAFTCIQFKVTWGTEGRAKGRSGELLYPARGTDAWPFIGGSQLRRLTGGTRRTRRRETRYGH